MKKIIVIAAVLFLCGACKNNTTVHQHEHSETAEMHQHNHAAAGDIILAPEKAHAAGVVAEIITPKDFRQVISVSGRIESSQNAEKSIVANVAGVVSFNRPLVSGTQVTQGNTLLSISSHNLQDGDPVERAQIAYQAADHGIWPHHFMENRWGNSRNSD